MKDLNRVLARISENTSVFIFGEFLSFDSMTGKGLLIKTRNSVKTLKISQNRFDIVVRQWSYPGSLPFSHFAAR